jgi:hypothetical protein
LTAIARHINAEHSQESLKGPKVQVPHRRVVVLLLAPCHSFPGFGLLPSLIERTRWTVQLFAPDCSPSVPVFTPETCLTDTCPTETETGIGTGKETEGHTVTESKRFESDPALFVSSMDWGGAGYVVTFNSYLDAISPLLTGGGFRPVSLVRTLCSLLTMVSML